MSENVVIGAKLQVDTDQAKQSVGSFKKELREAQEDLLKISERFGSISPQAVEAAKKVAQLNDRMGEAKNLVDAFNPDAKFRAFSNALQGVAGGFSTVTGLMGLLGSESEETQKLLLKVQSALAFSQGLNQLGDLKDSFKQLGAFIKSTTAFQYANTAATRLAAIAQNAFTGAVNTTSTSFKVLKGAIAATGIGLIIVLVGTLISKISDWVSGTDEAEAAQRRLNLALEAQEDLLNQNLKSLDYATKAQIARAKIAGKSEAEITKIQADASKERLATLKANADATDKIFEETVLNSKTKLEDVEKASKAKREAYQQWLDEMNKQELDSLEKQADAAVKAREKSAPKNNPQAKKLRDEALAETKAALDELKKLQDENYINSISDEQKRAEERIKLDASNSRKRFEAIKVTTKEESDIKNKLLSEVTIKENLELTEVRNKHAKENEDRIKASNDVIRKLEQEHFLAMIADERERNKERIQLEYELNVEETEAKFTALELTEQQKTELLAQYAIQRNDKLKAIDDELKAKQNEIKLELDNGELNDFELKNQQLDKWYKDRYEIVKGNLQLETQLTKEYEQRKTDIRKAEQFMQLNIISDTLGQAAALFGKATAASKVLALAQIATSTAVSYMQGLRIAQQSALGTGPAAAFAMPVFYASQIVAILGAVAKAKAALNGGTPGGSSSGQVSSFNAPNVLSPAAPLAPTQQGTAIDPALSNVGNATVRAFVVDADIQNNRERNERLNRAARLG